MIPRASALRRMLPLACLSVSAGLPPSAVASCGSAYCSVHTDWTSDRLGAGEGHALDVRYEFIDQNVPRSSSRRVGVGEVSRHHDEARTLNRNLLLNYSRGYASGWGYSVSLPLVDRDHLHIHNHHGAQLEERWSFRESGDVRLMGRRQAVVETDDGVRTTGVQVGLKLPSGRIGMANDSGDVAERSLQPGTGTTDVIVGAFHQRSLPAWSGAWFGELQYQRALRRHQDYAPGAQLTADVGVARQLTANLTGLLQLNAVVKARDRGGAAEPEDSGSRSLFLSPGLSHSFGDGTRVYAFYQQPLYQHVNGVQLTPRRALAVGVATRF